ncbi:MAG: hypothetical protein ACPG49_04530 [Chitinophagales bacterium]
MDSMQMILLAVAAFVGLWIIFKIAKAVFKIALFLGLMFLGYMVFFGGSIEDVLEPGLEQMFKKNTLEELKAKHCKPEKMDILKCECIVMPVYADLQDRFVDRKSELKELEKDREAITQEVLKSFGNQKENMKVCAKEKQSGLLKFFGMLKNIVQGFMSE